MVPAGALLRHAHRRRQDRHQPGRRRHQQLHRWCVHYLECNLKFHNREIGQIAGVDVRCDGSEAPSSLQQMHRQLCVLCAGYLAPSSDYSKIDEEQFQVGAAAAAAVSALFTSTSARRRSQDACCRHYSAGRDAVAQQPQALAPNAQVHEAVAALTLRCRLCAEHRGAARQAARVPGARPEGGLQEVRLDHRWATSSFSQLTENQQK